jgi:hypothetical protein
MTFSLLVFVLSVPLVFQESLSEETSCPICKAGSTSYGTVGKQRPLS